jgi:methylmalonyl-CoA mutase cobalamin-binding subunit
MLRNVNVIVASPESDAHVVALKLLELALEEQGNTPLNLGVCRPTREIAEAAADAVGDGPVAVLLSCQNGHGLTDLADLHDRLRALGVADAVHVFAGGRLAVGAETDREAVRRAYRALGITVLDSFEELFAALERLGSAAHAAPAPVRCRQPADA